MKSSAAPAWPSSTSSTSSGNSSGMGTLHRVPTTANRLASSRDLRCASARRRISAQVRRSATQAPLQPAIEQGRQTVQRLIAIGQQGVLAITLGQQGGKAGDAQVLGPGEVRLGGRAQLLAVEALGEGPAIQAGLLGQLDQQLRPGHVLALHVEGLLDQAEQARGAIAGQAAGGDQGATGRLGVIDEVVRQAALQVEGLACRTTSSMTPSRP